MSDQEKNVESANNQLQAAHLPTCDVSIDIGQILAANQALLKNMARRMEQMENKLTGMENAFNDQARLLTADRNAVLMLSAPPREVKPWEPAAGEKLDKSYFARFSLYDKLFRPWTLRRKNN
ncbi:MAG: hypothetical protein CVV41_15380 [Candidatus Riflebacteria bacterium HGW-Riflebacteria-1]|jgi:hypothetical protein|nr:MAG: hypothetical protein CVV41_15380 [Candidatus Riflebacteria bacterium HGW-Riflebacteria-1]